MACEVAYAERIVVHDQTEFCVFLAAELVRRMRRSQCDHPTRNFTVLGLMRSSVPPQWMMWRNIVLLVRITFDALRCRTKKYEFAI